mmetsp:Transcript_33176/g.100076  ORF Transcript_33176/g.100076 Transcript_33176/m.100076 type:complete len:101 (-) Transcript_33176:10-312(-)
MSSKLEAYLARRHKYDSLCRNTLASPAYDAQKFADDEEPFIPRPYALSSGGDAAFQWKVLPPTHGCSAPTPTRGGDLAARQSYGVARQSSSVGAGFFDDD